MPSRKALGSEMRECFVLQVMSLEVDHGVYVGPGGRINVSSLTEAAAKQVADAVIAVVK